MRLGLPDVESHIRLLEQFHAAAAEADVSGSA